jgi:tRNA G10  N-methylase Trm11
MSSLKQTSYVFIPGKNWRLSLAELVSFLEARKLEFRITCLSKFFFVVISEKALDPSLIVDFGGIMKIARVISRIPSKTLEDAFLCRKKQALADIKATLSANNAVNEIFKAPSKKLVFGVSLYTDGTRFIRLSKKIQRFMGSYFKENLAADGIKAKFMGVPEGRKLSQLTNVEVLKKGLIEKSAEIVVCMGKDQAYISRSIAVHNPFEFQKRDIARPFQRKIFSISPRLAKILVNLSSCLPSKVLLDPFCGVGTIVQEAMLLKAQVIGIDIDPWCVKASRVNLDWLKNEYNLDVEHKVLLGDSRNLTDQINEGTIDCIATEPDLGPALRHFPTGAYAKKIVDYLKPLYWDFLEGAFKVLKDGGNLVLVTPYIRTRTGTFVSLGVKEEARTMGFQIVCPFEGQIFAESNPLIEDLSRTTSFVDMEERHKIGREIHIFQK